MKKCISIIFLFSIKIVFSQDLTGYYSGINKQHIGNEYPVELAIKFESNTLKGVINYSSLDCYGEMDFKGKTYDNRYFFQEKLFKINNCVTGGTIILEPVDENSIVYYWYYANGELGSATILKKSRYKENEGDCNEPIQLYGDSSGIYEVFTTLNDVLNISFILDSGASEVSITPDVALTLVRTGTIKDEDWLEGKTYMFADGSTARSKRFRLRKLIIGNYVIRDVEVSIANSLEAPMLLGQNVMRKLGKVSIDYRNNILCVEK